MHADLLCPLCPYEHPATDPDCPGGWRNIRAAGGDHPAHVGPIDWPLAFALSFAGWTLLIAAVWAITWAAA